MADGGPWLPDLLPQPETDAAMDEVWHGVELATDYARTRTHKPPKAAATLLLGPRGCGKSNRLYALVQRRARAHRGSFNVYIDLLKVVPFLSLSERLWRLFGAWRASQSLASGRRSNDTMSATVAAIRGATGYPPLVVLDEFHCAYGDDRGEDALLIRELVMAGDFNDGQAITVLCGREVAHALAFCHLPRELAAHYPAYRPNKSLNETKYRVHALPPLSRRVVSRMVNAFTGAEVTDDVAERVFIAVGGNGALVDGAVRLGREPSSWDRAAKFDERLHVALRRAIERREGLRPAEWDVYVELVVRDDTPAWVTTRELAAAYAPKDAFSSAQWLRRCFSWADESLLRVDWEHDELRVTFACAWQALRCESTAADGDVATLTTYDRLCLRYPYGVLGLHAEDVVARSLVAFDGAVGGAALSTALNAATNVGPTGRCEKLSFPEVGDPAALASAERADRHACCMLVAGAAASLRAARGVECLVVSGGLPRSLRDKLVFLRRRQGVVFKKHPDVYGNDLLWWRVAGNTVHVFRARVELGTSELDVPEACERLAGAWGKIKPFFYVGRNYAVSCTHLLLTTRAIAAEWAAPSAHAGGGPAVGEAAVWGDRDALAVSVVDRRLLSLLWVPAISEFADRCYLFHLARLEVVPVDESDPE